MARLVLQRGRVFCDGTAEVAGLAQCIAARVVLLRSRSCRFILSRHMPLRMSLSPQMILCHRVVLFEYVNPTVGGNQTVPHALLDAGCLLEEFLGSEL